MPLGDDGIAGGQRRREVASGDPVEREGKIVRSDDEHGAERCVDRADARFRVDRRQRPRAVAAGRGRLPELPGRARQFDVLQPRRHRQARLTCRDPGQLIGVGVDRRRVAFEESCNLLAWHAGEPCERVIRSRKDAVALHAIADRKPSLQRLPRRGVERGERLAARGRHPPPVDPHLCCRHARHLLASPP